MEAQAVPKGAAEATADLAPPTPPPSTEAQGSHARDLLLELFRHLGLSAEVAVRGGTDDISLHAKLSDVPEGAGLSGPRPTMQEPLAYLLSKMVNRGIPEGGARAFVKLSFGDAAPSEVVPVPVEETDPEIVELGRELATRAKSLKKTLTVGPMSARERRSLHVAIKEAGGATTRSEGEGLLRRVLIIPDAEGAPVAAAK